MPETVTMRIGTIVWLNQAGAHWQIGQLADIVKNQWGSTYHIALPNGTFANTSSIGDCAMKSIGWRFATLAEIARYNELFKGSSDPAAIINYASGVVIVDDDNPCRSVDVNMSGK